LTRLRVSSGRPIETRSIQKIFSGQGGRPVDRGRVIYRRHDGQGVRKYYRKHDGSWVLARELQPGVIEFGRLVIIRDRTILDGFEDALNRARAALRAGLVAGDADEALAVFEANTDAALALLRESLGEGLEP
jgi:hypothetical protein